MFPQARGAVTSVAFSPDCHRVLSGGGIFDNTVRLWSAPRGENCAYCEAMNRELTAWRFRPMAALQ